MTRAISAETAALVTLNRPIGAIMQHRSEHRCSLGEAHADIAAYNASIGKEENPALQVVIHKARARLGEFDPYAESEIKRDDTNALALTMQQIYALVSWARGQTCSLFESLTIAETLAIYHASIEFEDFEAWLDEETHCAAMAYNCCVFHEGEMLTPDGYDNPPLPANYVPRLDVADLATRLTAADDENTGAGTCVELGTYHDDQHSRLHVSGIFGAGVAYELAVFLAHHGPVKARAVAKLERELEDAADIEALFGDDAPASGETVIVTEEGLGDGLCNVASDPAPVFNPDKFRETVALIPAVGEAVLRTLDDAPDVDVSALKTLEIESDHNPRLDKDEPALDYSARITDRDDSGSSSDN